MKHLSPLSEELSLWTQGLFFPIYSKFHFYYNPESMRDVSKTSLFTEFNNSVKKLFSDLGNPICLFQPYHMGCFITVYGRVDAKTIRSILITGKNKNKQIRIDVEVMEMSSRSPDEDRDDDDEIKMSFILHWDLKGFVK